jgi:hypothetical protein
MRGKYREAAAVGFQKLDFLQISIEINRADRQHHAGTYSYRRPTMRERLEQALWRWWSLA